MRKGDQYLLITALLSSGRILEGEKAIESARDDLPIPVLLECWGNVHFYRREFQEAIVKYEEAMTSQMDYDSARYHYLIGVQEERQRHQLEAFTRYQSAIEIEPTFVDSYVELGGLLVKVGDLEGALKCYTDALNLEPADLRNYWNKMQVLDRLSKEDPIRYANEYQIAKTAFEVAKARLPAIDERTDW